MELTYILEVGVVQWKVCDWTVIYDVCQCKKYCVTLN